MCGSYSSNPSSNPTLTVTPVAKVEYDILLVNVDNAEGTQKIADAITELSGLSAEVVTRKVEG